MALLLDQFPANNLEAMALLCQEYSIAQRFDYILRETQSRLSLLISLNKESPEDTYKTQPKARIQAIINDPDTTDTSNTSNTATSNTANNQQIDIQALLQAQAALLTKLTNQFKNSGKIGRGNDSNSGGGRDG